MGIIQRLFPDKIKPIIQAVEKQNEALLELKARISIAPPIEFRFNPVNGNFMVAPAVQNVQKYIDKGYNTNSTVYSIISTCANKFSSIPWMLYKVKNTQKALQYETLSKSYTGEPSHLIRLMKLKAQAFDELPENTPAMEMWNNPNPMQTGPEFRANALMFKMLTGSSPIWAEKGGTRVKMLEMWVLPTQYIQLYPDETLNQIGRITYNINGVQMPIPVEDILYWKYNNPNWDIVGTQLYGQAPLRAGNIEIDAANQNVLAQKFMFEHAGVSGLWTPKDVGTAAALTPNSPIADALRTTMSQLQNSREHGTDARPFVNYPMEYTSYGMDSQQMQLVESGRLLKETIANLFNYPIPLLSSQASTYNNVDSAVKYVVTNTIYADLCSFRDKNNAWFLPQFGYRKGEAYLDFDISGLPELQGDFQKMVDSMAKMDWITFDEKREAMKYDAKGGAYDTAYIPSSSIPIELAGDMGTIPNNNTY